MSSTINSKIDALFSKLKNKEPIKSKFETQVENLTLLKKNTKAVEAIEKFIIEKALSCTQHRKSNPNNARIANMYRDLFKEFFTLCDLLESTHNADRETLKLYFSLDKKLYSQLRRYQRYSLETFPALNIRDLSIEDLRHYPILDGSLITDIFNSYPEAMKEFMKDYIHIMPNSIVKYVKNKEKEKPSTPAESYINNKITNDFEFKTFLNNLDDKFKIKRCEKAFFEFDYLENGEALLSLSYLYKAISTKYSDNENKNFASFKKSLLKAVISKAHLNLVICKWKFDKSKNLPKFRNFLSKNPDFAKDCFHILKESYINVNFLFYFYHSVSDTDNKKLFFDLIMSIYTEEIKSNLPFIDLSRSPDEFVNSVFLEIERQYFDYIENY